MGTTDASVRMLNYNSIGDNASTSPTTQHLGRGGPNKLNDASSPLANEAILTNDTSILNVPPDGTVESNGANG